MRWIAAISGCLFLGGCAMPVPLQVAGWAADVFSVVATEKTITDHGISAVTKQDCALMRVVTEENRKVCRAPEDDVEDAPIQTALAAPDAGAPVAGIVTDDAAETSRAASELSAEELANFETAAGGNESSAVGKAVEPQVETSSPTPTKATPTHEPKATLTVAMDTLSKEKLETPATRPVALASLEAPAPADPPAGLANADRLGSDPQPGVYLVVASARGESRARALLNDHNDLGPTVIQANLKRDGKQVFRIVVGPLKDGGTWKDEARRLAETGVQNAWAINVAPGDWTVTAVATPPTLAKGTAPKSHDVAPQPHAAAGAGHVLQSMDWPGLHRVLGGGTQLAQR